LLLNGGGGVIAFMLQCTQYGLNEVEFVEFHVK
jgi:hypothetical protein